MCEAVTGRPEDRVCFCLEVTDSLREKLEPLQSHLVTACICSIPPVGRACRVFIYNLELETIVVLPDTHLCVFIQI